MKNVPYKQTYDNDDSLKDFRLLPQFPKEQREEVRVPGKVEKMFNIHYA